MENIDDMGPSAELINMKKIMCHPDSPFYNIFENI